MQLRYGSEVLISILLLWLDYSGKDLFWFCYFLWFKQQPLTLSLVVVPLLPYLLSLIEF